MDSDSSIYLILIVISIILSGFFSATETAFSTMNRIRMKNLSEKGNKNASLAIKLHERYDVFISTILIGNNIVNILSASLATILFVQLLGQDLGATISTIVTTIVVLIFGEVTPKSIAKEYPEKFALFAAPIVNVLEKVFLPFNFFFKQWKVLMSKIIKPNEDRSITEEELLTIVDEAQEGGGINETEGTLIRSAIEFSELEAIDIYTPRVDMECIPVDATKEEIQKVFVETGYSRLPVYEGNIDHIIGIINHKDFYNYVYSSNKNINEIIKPALYITKNKKIDMLLKELQLKKMHIAIVLDEFGGTVGLLTLEDILEELVGEIWDEHDTIIHEIEKISDNEYLVMGNANVDKFFEVIGKDEELDVLTVNGWVVETLGHIPTEKEVYEANQIRFEVLKMNGKRIEQVKITLIPTSETQSE
ncbi:hemolysin family protein [Acholeplasma vituli]|uniref:Hemolysin family protein n=1 Tax=Paracholeplasma vituli TaxID=69473 RepID=A0ABT2PVG1_9MOLU|nr:hemolysin family protein [Paracholeplasma vituli]MCU0104936.1 hemolysin family protein [Paracholeplasma vituli]